VRAYLREFLSDPRVVEIPRFVWWPILHFIVLTTRPNASAQRYAQIWMSEGSPLRVHTERQVTLLRAHLSERAQNLPLTVDYAMRYGAPSIADRLREMKAQQCSRILLLPLYPQYSASTTATAVDAAFLSLLEMRNQPALRSVRSFHDHPGYIAALARSARDYWARNGRPDVLLMSFHGVPRAALDQGDPYHCECQATGRLLAQALGLREEQYRVTFQSRFGRAEWLKPYTAETVAGLARTGTRNLVVITPGFAADCVETLEEIAIGVRESFLEHGGQNFTHVPCLNAADDHIALLAALVRRELAGWI
jgi:ferrochelatase